MTTAFNLVKSDSNEIGIALISFVGFIILCFLLMLASESHCILIGMLLGIIVGQSIGRIDSWITKMKPDDSRKRVPKKPPDKVFHIRSRTLTLIVLFGIAVVAILINSDSDRWSKDQSCTASRRRRRIPAECSHQQEASLTRHIFKSIACVTQDDAEFGVSNDINSRFDATTRGGILPGITIDSHLNVFNEVPHGILKVNASPANDSITHFRDVASKMIGFVYVVDYIILDRDNFLIDWFNHGTEYSAAMHFVLGNFTKFLGFNVNIDESNIYSAAHPSTITIIYGTFTNTCRYVHFGLKVLGTIIANRNATIIGNAQCNASVLGSVQCDAPFSVYNISINDTKTLAVDPGNTQTIPESFNIGESICGAAENRSLPD